MRSVPSDDFERSETKQTATHCSTVPLYTQSNDVAAHSEIFKQIVG
jgi:hypothetical protein